MLVAFCIKWNRRAFKVERLWHKNILEKKLWFSSQQLLGTNARLCWCTDAETRMDETPLIEKFKKGSLQAFPVSLAAQIGTTATAWSKRKRHGSSEAQILLERTNVGKNSAERAEMAPSEEEDDEAPVLPSFTPFGRSRSKERAKVQSSVFSKIWQKNSFRGLQSPHFAGGWACHGYFQHSKESAIFLL